MKRKAKKLILNRDVLRTAAPSELAAVAGGITALCGSAHCTETCNVTAPSTYCVCDPPESIPVRSCGSGTCP